MELKAIIGKAGKQRTANVTGVPPDLICIGVSSIVDHVTDTDIVAMQAEAFSQARILYSRISGPDMQEQAKHGMAACHAQTLIEFRP